MTEAPIICLERFGVAFADHVVLDDVTLALPRVGITLLVGPAGAGKSTLLRTLAGLNDPQPSLRTWGSLVVEGEPVSDARRRRLDDPGSAVTRRIGLVVQNTRFYMASVRENLASTLPDRAALSRSEQVDAIRTILRDHGLAELADQLEERVVSLPLAVQRRLAIVRVAATPARLLMIDEPTAGLEPDEAQPVIALLEMLARGRSTLVVTHNQRHARALGGRTALLAGGRIREIQDTSAFFEQPRTELARSFVRTGGCTVPPPAEEYETIRAVAPSREASRPPSRYEGPRGFYWLRPGSLGGCPRPGLLEELDHDLDALARLRVTQLICLEETQTIEAARLSARSIGSIHSPIPDMGAPTLDQAEALCAEIAGLVARGEVVAVHCRAGLGRTGTLLACVLIRDGMPALEALEAIRNINPGWVQSSRQIEFLEQFENARGSHGEGPHAA